MSEFISRSGEGEPPALSGQNNIFVNEVQGEAHSKASGTLENILENVTMTYDQFYAAYPDRSWLDTKAKGDEKQFRYVIIHSYCVAHNGSHYCEFMVDKFIPSRGSKPGTKEVIEVRRRIVTVSNDGEKIFPAFSIPAARFVQQFAPDAWMTKSEFESILADLKPQIDRDMAMLDSEKQWLENCNKVNAAAAASRTNPEASLGAAIAQGVAAALKNLNVKGA